MAIELSILPHQDDFLAALKKVFADIHVICSDDIYANPLIDLEDEKLQQNINELWQGYAELKPIPKAWQTKDDENYLGLDIRMETGTGKTYCYTRLMYELNAMHGFNKFIILVPSTPIKEGSKSFLQANYSKRHFADLYPNKSLDLAILEPQKKSGARKMFPSAIAEFARASSLEKNRFSVLLMTSGMLLSNATMAKDDYDQTILGNFTNPYAALKSTKPIVIIDEPHRFKKENQAYKRILKELQPQCIIRFGATFPDKDKGKDYNNLIFNLGSSQAFNQNLVKGVETFMIDAEKENETKLKLMDFKRSPKICLFRDEKTKKSIELLKGDNLAIFGQEFLGISIDEIGPTSDEAIKSGVSLSNGQILAKGDIVYGGIYTETYQELMLKQSIINHLKTEKENFLRANKIKTLSLYFIDSVRSYRDENGGAGHLRIKFENMLKEALKNEIDAIGETKDLKLKEYKSYLKASLADISKTNGGYFSEDNASSEEDIQNEVDKILRDKEFLLNFSDNNSWNTMRFIFSKWTLKEGWDNPNVFQIVKLRSSGSETSKLQEVGRGLRLPVDEKGRRICDEQFYLSYLIDYSEKGFASKLLGEIQKDTPNQTANIKQYLGEIAKIENKSENEVFGQMLDKNYIDYNGNINLENLDNLYFEYPQVISGLKPHKIIDGTRKKNFVKVRKDKFAQIAKLWQSINKKYYLKFDAITDDELIKVLIGILEKSDIYKDSSVNVISKRTESLGDKVVLRERISNSYIVEDRLSYGEFLKQFHKKTGISINIVHKAFCKFSKDKKEIDKRLFSKTGVILFVREFNGWLDEMLVKRFSYRALDIALKQTSLTDYNGNVVDRVLQGVLGIHRDDALHTPEKFIYDSVIYDSPKERETLISSDIDEVVVFGKIPRKSIQIPLFTGGTTSPDFIYVVKSNGNCEINFIVETKDIKDDKSLRVEEKYKIESAKKFFESLKKDGLNVVFKKQLKNDDIVAMIRGL